MPNQPTMLNKPATVNQKITQQPINPPTTNQPDKLNRPTSQPTLRHLLTPTQPIPSHPSAKPLHPTAAVQARTQPTFATRRGAVRRRRLAATSAAAPANTTAAAATATAATTHHAPAKRRGAGFRSSAPACRPVARPRGSAGQLPGVRDFRRAGASWPRGMPHHMAKKALLGVLDTARDSKAVVGSRRASTNVKNWDGDG